MSENGCRFVWNDTLFLLPLHTNNPETLLMESRGFINFKNWGGYERFVNKRLAVPTSLTVFLLPFVLAACEKENTTTDSILIDTNIDISEDDAARVAPPPPHTHRGLRGLGYAEAGGL